MYKSRVNATLGVRHAAAAILLLALALRVGAVLATPDYRPIHDDRDYDRHACWVALHGFLPTRLPPLPSPRSCAPATLLPQHNGVSGPLVRVHQRPGILTAYRPPLWPLTLGGAYALTGRLPIGRWTAGRLLQAAIGTATVALTGAIAAEVWGWGIGLIAMALAALFLPLVLDGDTLISEPLFVALELAAVLAALRQRRSPAGLRWALAAGALAGLAALTRSTGALLVLALLPLAWVRMPRRRWRSLAGPGTLALTAALVVAPWTIRNAVVLRAFVPVSTETGPTLLGTYNAAARSSRTCHGCWLLLASRRRYQGLMRRMRRLDEVQRDRLGRTLALRLIGRHPEYVAEVAWGNSLRLLELGGAARTRYTATRIDVSPRAAVAGAWELWGIVLLATLGAALGALRRAPRALIALPAFLWVATVLVQSETPRFRAPIDPFLLMLAATTFPWAARSAGAAAARRRAVAAR